MSDLASLAALQKIHVLMFSYEHMYALLLIPFTLEESNLEYLKIYLSSGAY